MMLLGNLVSQIKLEQIPMMDRTACMEAADTFKNNSIYHETFSKKKLKFNPA